MCKRWYARRADRSLRLRPRPCGEELFVAPRIMRQRLITRLSNPPYLCRISQFLILF